MTLPAPLRRLAAVALVALSAVPFVLVAPTIAGQHHRGHATAAHTSSHHR